jgi:hypothetical protein
VKIDVLQAVDQRFAFIHNHAFEAISPKIASAIMAPVVIPGKANLDLPYKFGEAGQLFRYKGNLALPPFLLSRDSSAILM